MTDSAASDSSIGSALRTGRSLILLQLLSRLLTFTLNQSLIRLSTPEVFGTAAIQFDLICSSILFLSREGVRNALLRRITTTDGQETKSDAARGLAVIPLYLGLVVSSLITTIYLYTSSVSTTSQKDFHLSLGMYILGALLELSIEPHYIRALRSSPSKLHVRVQAEGGMAITKAIVTFLYLYRFPQNPLLGFAVGQVGGAIWLVGRYLVEFGVDGLLWVSAPKGAKTFEPELSKLAIANTRQSLIKHVLTEADRIAVGRISPLADQGGYALAMNYGSLVARIIFQPIEETLLLHFSSNPTSRSAGPLLGFILHLSSHLLLLLPSFLPPLLPPILRILLPRRYLATSAPRTLETYLCWYIPLLSLNGILEAYHTASATPAQMDIQGRWMIASSLTFVGSLYTLRQRGLSTETALIGASCIGMLVRILYAFLHARTKVGLGIRDLFPKSQVTLTAVVSGTVLRRIYRTGRWTQGWALWLEFLGFGAALGLVTLGVIWRVERNGFTELQKSLRGKKE